MVAHQIPVFSGETMVSPGGIIVADIDAAPGVPRRVACDVLRRTAQVIRFVNIIKGWVDAGDSLSEIVKKGG